MTRKLSIQKLTLLSFAILPTQQTFAPPKNAWGPTPQAAQSSGSSDMPAIEDVEKARDSGKRCKAGSKVTANDTSPAKPLEKTTKPKRTASSEQDPCVENGFVDSARVLSQKPAPAQPTTTPAQSTATTSGGVLSWLFGGNTSQEAPSPTAQPLTVFEHVQRGTLEQALANPEAHIVEAERGRNLNHALQCALADASTAANQALDQQQQALLEARNNLQATHQAHQERLAAIAYALQKREMFQRKEGVILKELNLALQNRGRKEAQDGLRMGLQVYNDSAGVLDQLETAAKQSHASVSQFTPVEDHAALTPRTFARQQADSIKAAQEQT